VPSRVDATVISAFAATHGMSVATSGTAALEASPTPPPNRTNLAKEPNALPPTGRASDALAGFGESGDVIGSPSRTGPERRRMGFDIDGTVEPEQRLPRPACRRRRGRQPAPVAVSPTAPAICLLFCIMLSIGRSSSGARRLVCPPCSLTMAAAADTALTAR
jgi:hypothetical protein